jgi:hypothetical protein
MAANTPLIAWKNILVAGAYVAVSISGVWKTWRRDSSPHMQFWTQFNKISQGYNLNRFIL